MSVDNHGGHNGPDGGAEVQSPDWEDVARSEFSVRVREQGDDLRNAFHKTATLLNDGHEVEAEDLEALRSELRYKRTFVEESLTNAATYAPGDGVERLRALEWEMLQFYQLLATEISRHGVREDTIEQRMKEHEAMGEQLEQLLRDVQEGDQ